MTTIERLNCLVNNYKESKQSYEYYKFIEKNLNQIVKDIDVLLVNYSSSRLVNKMLEEKVDKLNKQLQEELEYTIGIVEHNRIISEKNRKIRQLKKQINSDKKELCNRLIRNWNKLKKYLTNRYNNGTESIRYRDAFLEIRAIMQELEQGDDSNEN